MLQRPLTGLLTIVLAALLVSPALGIDDAHWRKANEIMDKGVAYLRATQNDDGSWSPDPGPAITAMAMQVLLDRPGVGVDDPAVQKALAYVMSKQRPDGGIHDGILENYNTSICLSALSRLRDQPGVDQAVIKAQKYLRDLQWSNQKLPNGETVDENHPFYGGAGYGGHGRPDMSNTQMMIQALHDSGLDCEDPAYQRAMIFITRCQGVEQNEMLGDKIVPDGGFIYSTTINKDRVGVPESKASPELIDEGKAGRPVSGLRTYGSMTYAGFKSYLYAELERDDPRVAAAYDWVRHNYTLESNPGMLDNPATELPEDQQGLYYYYVTFARGLRAWGTADLQTADGTKHDWANDLVDALAARQREDGSWINEHDRWNEGDANLVTAYALIALGEAVQPLQAAGK